jgi:hypothetical protein
MKFKVGDEVVSKREIIESACGDHPCFLLCSARQKLIIKNCYPAEDFPKHGFNSYSVQDISKRYDEFFIDEKELEDPKWPNTTQEN